MKTNCLNEKTNLSIDFFLFIIFFYQVSLLPPVLARKRVWNKKYPICIILADGEVEEESLIEGQEEEERTDKQMFPDTLSDLPVILYLFGRTGREKEEWFQHFLSASRPEFKSCQSREGSKSGKKKIVHTSSVAIKYVPHSFPLSPSHFSQFLFFFPLSRSYEQ